MEIIYGAVGALIAMLLFIGGGLLGWFIRGRLERQRVRRTAKELTKRELQALKEQQEAFRQMQNYTPEIAYGYNPKEELGGELA